MHRDSDRETADDAHRPDRSDEPSPSPASDVALRTIDHEAREVDAGDVARDLIDPGGTAAVLAEAEDSAGQEGGELGWGESGHAEGKVPPSPAKGPGEGG